MKRTVLAAALLVSTCFTSITPAFADDGDNVILSPVNLDGPSDPQALCEEVLRPAAASGFQTEPTSVTEGSWVNVGDPERDANVGDPVPTGSPTSSFVILTGGYFRNGGSPNVWGHGTATLTYPNSTQEYTTIQHQEQTVTVGCRVWKYTGPDGDHLVQPPGLQTTGNSFINGQDVAGANGFDTNNGPIVLTGQEVYALICISPGSKGGKWTGKNGFPATSCAAASTAAGGTIPSGNIPQI